MRAYPLVVVALSLIAGSAGFVTHRALLAGSEPSFVKILAEADAPLAYGCLFGKDRTGVASSILLEVLNVHDEEILKDYSETEKHIDPLYRRFKMLWKDFNLTDEEVAAHHLATPPEIMDGFLEHLRTELIHEEAKLLIDHLPYDTRTKLQNRLLD